jgi:multiple sugar transport system substrate-binding protein/sorbitol/mannitol transport system substrate-binding protein
LKKKLCKILAIALVGVLVLAACTPDAPTPEPTPQPETPTDPAAPAVETPPAPELPADFNPADFDVSTVEGWGEAMRALHGGTTITAAMATHPGTEAMQHAMVADFTALTGIEVNWVVLNEVQLQTDIRLDFAAGAGNYDVIMTDGFWIAGFAADGVLAPLQPFIDDSFRTPDWYDFDDLIAAYTTGISAVGGVQLSIPMAGETRFIAYRTDLFEEHGREPPTTMAEFLELAQFFNGIEDGMFGVSMRAASGIHAASGWMTVMYNFSDGFMDQVTMEPTMDDPGTIESLQFFVDLLQNAPPDVTTFTHEEAVGTFMNGHAAMWLDATALASRILDPAQSQVYDRVGFVPTPTGPAGDAAALAGWGLGIGANSRQQDAAWAFITYMTGRPQSVTYVQNGGTPVRESVYLDPVLVAADPSFPVQLESFERAEALVARGVSWLPPTENLGPMLDIIGVLASRAITGEITVQEAIDMAQEDLLDLGL